MTTCVRGCTHYRRHLNTCPVRDHSTGAWISWHDDPNTPILDRVFSATERSGIHGDYLTHLASTVHIGRWGGLETWHECRGCKPRDATHGHLCEHCHDRLTSWLADLQWLYRWLTTNITPGNAAGAKQDWQRPGTTDGHAAPLRIAVLDVRNLLTDRLLELEDCARDVLDRPARRTRFSLRDATNFLTAWLSAIENDMDLVMHMFELLEDLFRRAKAVVPWEDRPRRIAGIICPQCERATLEVRPGMEDVTCRSCGAVIPRKRYDIWTRILADEAAGTAS